MQQEAPEEFQKAVEFERELQKVAADNPGLLSGVPYLHYSLKNLDEVDWAAAAEKGKSVPDQFKNECEGMCGV